MEQRIDVFDKIRMPLILSICFLHTGYSQVDSLIVECLCKLAWLAVPTFFLISGYLFFYNIKGTFAQKIKRRVKNNLFPYIAWNSIWLIVFTIFGVREFALSDLWGGGIRLIKEP